MPLSFWNYYFQKNENTSTELKSIHMFPCWEHTRECFVGEFNKTLTPSKRRICQSSWDKLLSDVRRQQPSLVFFAWIYCLFQEDWNLQKSGILNLRRSEVANLRGSGVTNLRRTRTLNLWRSGVMNLRSLQVVNLWRSGITNLRTLQVVNLRSSGIMNQRNCVSRSLKFGSYGWRIRESEEGQVKDVTSKVRVWCVN
jgi:hypothetical protein